MMFYSKSTNGFYDNNLHENMPQDAVTVSDDTYQSLLAAQATGQVISADANGNPVAGKPVISLVQAQASQISLLSTACQTSITSGFASKALDQSCGYGSQLTDQNNLLSALSASQGQASGWTTSLWCQQGGVWSFQSHTAAQVAQVNADWVSFRTAVQSKYAGFVTQVQAATTVEVVQAITWE